MIMRGWLHACSILAGIAVPAAITVWSTSDSGVRSKAHYAAIDQSALPARDVVMAFEKMAIDEGHPREAVMRYFAEDVVDHDPNIAGDRDSMIAMLARNNWGRNGGAKGGPTRTIKHVVSEGDMVVVHHHLVREPGTPGLAAVDIFRVRDGLIVEHWDVLQPITTDSPNRFGPF